MYVGHSIINGNEPVTLKVSIAQQIVLYQNSYWSKSHILVQRN